MTLEVAWGIYKRVYRTHCGINVGGTKNYRRVELGFIYLCSR